VRSSIVHCMLQAHCKQSHGCMCKLHEEFQAQDRCEAWHVLLLPTTTGAVTTTLAHLCAGRSA
jgi:hypothetical protein